MVLVIDRGTCNFDLKVVQRRSVPARSRHRRRTTCRHRHLRHGRHQGGGSRSRAADGQPRPTARAIKAAPGQSGKVQASHPPPIKRDSEPGRGHRRLARVRPRPDVADDRQHERPDGGRHRRGHGRRAGRHRQRRRRSSATTRSATRSGSGRVVRGLHAGRTATSSARRSTSTASSTAPSAGDLLGELQGAALGQDEMLADLVDGMNFTPAGPKFEQMRDGILMQLTTSGHADRTCMVWGLLRPVRRRGRRDQQGPRQEDHRDRVVRGASECAT